VKGINVAKLKSPQTRGVFQLKLRNQFQIPEEVSVEPEVSSVTGVGQKSWDSKEEEGTWDKG